MIKRGFLLQTSKKDSRQPTSQKGRQRHQQDRNNKKLQKPYLQKTTYATQQYDYVQKQSNATDRTRRQETKQKRQQMKPWQRRFYLNQILQFIFEVADRNQVYRANFIHAHIPFVIIFKLLEIEINTSQQTYLKEVIKVLINKIKQKNLKAQLDNKQVYDQFMIVSANPSATQQSLLSFLRKFIELNQEIMKGLLPYYYNYFALVVNKQIAFNGKPGQLLQYTIDYKHEQPYKQNFTQSDITNILDLFEKKLAQQYHSDDI